MIPPRGIPAAALNTKRKRRTKKSRRSQLYQRPNVVGPLLFQPTFHRTLFNSSIAEWNNDASNVINDYRYRDSPSILVSSLMVMRTAIIVNLIVVEFPLSFFSIRCKWFFFGYTVPFKSLDYFQYWNVNTRMKNNVLDWCVWSVSCDEDLLTLNLPLLVKLTVFKFLHKFKHI